MRGMGTMLVVLAAALALAQPATASDKGTLKRYAEATWRSFATIS